MCRILATLRWFPMTVICVLIFFSSSIRFTYYWFSKKQLLVSLISCYFSVFYLMDLDCGVYYFRYSPQSGSRLLCFFSFWRLVHFEKLPFCRRPSVRSLLQVPQMQLCHFLTQFKKVFSSSFFNLCIFRVLTRFLNTQGYSQALFATDANFIWLWLEKTFYRSWFF